MLIGEISTGRILQNVTSDVVIVREITSQSSVATVIAEPK